MKYLAIVLFVCSFSLLHAETMSEFIRDNGCNSNYICNGSCKKVSACHFARLHQDVRRINSTSAMTIKNIDVKQLDNLNLSLLNTILIFALFSIQLFFCCFFLRRGKTKRGGK